MTAERLGRLALADLRERTRRGAYLVTLVAILAAASLGLPAGNAGYATVDLDGWRGLYNSAWVGASTAMLASLFLSLIGFYLVKNSLDADRKSGVGEILASTPLSRFDYLLAKAVSNFALLASLVAVVLVMSGVMQFLRAEDRALDPVAIATPFVLITLPLMAVVAGLAVLFEAVPALRGSLGNVAWFFVWTGILMAPTMSSQAMTGGPAPLWTDPLGINLVVSQMVRGVRTVFPEFEGGSLSIGVNVGARVLKTFTWAGLTWEPLAVIGRLSWFLWAVGLVGLAVPAFDRFARSGAPAESRPGRGRKGRRAAPAGDESESTAAIPAILPARRAISAEGLTPLPARRGAPSIPRLVRAELRLMLQGLSRWWWLVAAGLVIAGSLVTAEARAVLGPIAWIWPLSLWSALGARESLSGTAALLDSSPRPVVRRLVAQWLAGLLVALGAGLGIGVGALRAGDPGLLAGWLAGAAFIPALALAAGAWSGSRRLFEALYIFLWYCGPMNRTPGLDFTGQSPGALASGTPVAFIIAAGALLALAVLARRRRLAFA